MAGKAVEKRELILAKAEQVFIRKGFNSVTMKDIIEECGISRGGIYLYFSSVDEIFMEVIKLHNQSKLEQTKLNIKKTSSFEAMLDDYLNMQKERLLHMENSLLLAMFEFFIAHKSEPDKDFFTDSFDSLKTSILEIMYRGVEEGYLDGDNVHVLASHILFCIKGLETKAISGGVTEELLNIQFNFCKEIIFSWKEGAQNEG